MSRMASARPKRRRQRKRRRFEGPGWHVPLIALALSLSLVLVLGLRPQSLTNPQLVVSTAQPPEQPAGAPHGSVAFRIQNAGSGPLRIYEARSHCGLTLRWHGTPCADCPPALAQGESALLLVSVPADSPGGSNHPTVTLYSNDPARPSLTLTVPR